MVIQEMGHVKNEKRNAAVICEMLKAIALKGSIKKKEGLVLRPDCLRPSPLVGL